MRIFPKGVPSLTAPMLITIRGDDQQPPFTLALLPGVRGGVVLRVFANVVDDPATEADTALGEIRIARSGIVATAEVWTAEMIRAPYEVDGVHFTLAHLLRS